MMHAPRHGMHVSNETVTRLAVPVASSALLAASLVVWGISLDSIDLRHVTDVGLISALPPSFFGALLLLSASFGLAVAGRRVVPLLPLQLAAQVLILFGTPSFVEYGPRTQSAWRLAGIVDYIAQNHSIDRSFDAFFNWPGFFIVVSFVTEAAGLESSLELARWAPLFFNLAYALPLLVIFRALALSDRQMWLGLWIFFAGNWIGQDYLAPQAFAYFIYLVIIALILAAFPAGEDFRSRGRLPGSPSSRMRVAIVGFVLVLQAVLAVSHQLTPWMAAFGVAVLVLVRRLPSFGLPVVMALMAATWVLLFTGPYLSGNFGTVAAPVGSVAQNVDTNLGSRFEGNSGHLLVLRVRVLFSLGLLLLGVWGAVQLRRSRAPLRTIGLLAIAPFLLLGLQTYGGELLLRTFLFSLPFVALAGAAALAPLFATPGSLRQLAATGILFAIGVGLLAARYGNEKADFFTKDEVAAVQFIHATAPKGAHVFAVSENTPWRFEHYADYKYGTLPSSVVRNSFAVVADRVDVTSSATPPPPPGSSTFSVNDATTGTGLNQFEFGGSWTAGSDAPAFGGDEHYSNSPGAYAQVRFTGTQVKVYTTQDPQHGIQAVSIDGGPETMVDLYASTRANQVLLYTSPLLPDGPHTLKVRVTGTKNGNASDSIINDVVRLMNVAPRSSYLLLTRSQAASLELFSGLSSETINSFRAKLVRSGRFRVIFSNQDATVITLRTAAR